MNGPNISTGLKTQMTDHWIDDIIAKMTNSNQPADIQLLGRQLRDAKRDKLLDKHVIGMCKNCPDPNGGQPFNQLIHGKL